MKQSFIKNAEKDTMLAEVMYMSSLRHPNIIAFKHAFIKPFDQTQLNLYIVMEYIDGGNLKDCINQRT